MMASLYDWLVSVQQASPHLMKALLAGGLVSTTCALIGCFIVLRRTSFLADAVAHSMLAGVVAGYLLMKLVYGDSAHTGAMLIGSIISGIITVAMVSFVSRASRVKEDAVIGIMYTGIFALGGVMVSFFSDVIHIDLYHFVIGSLLGVGDADLWMMGTVSCVVVVFIVMTFRWLQIITFDRVMAASIGIPVVLMDYLLTMSTSLVVVSGVRMVGVILVVGLLIAPAATAYLLCDRLRNMLWVSALLGWTGFLLGYIASEFMNVTPGSAIVVVLTAQFLFVFVIAPRYGLLADWRRRLTALPQQEVEDILGSVLRADGETLSLQQIAGYLNKRPERLRRAAASLDRQGLLAGDSQGYTLTDDGRKEARRLLRAHRLWETYLREAGVHEENLHAHAHVLEHVHDEDAVDYLDDKLGHPLTDPHGSEIPEDFLHLVPGELVKLAILREGHTGRIHSIGNLVSDQAIAGETVAVGPREDKGRIWVVSVTDASGNIRTLRLDHDQADDVSIRLD